MPFSIYFIDTLVDLTPLHLNKKYRHLLGKNLDVFPKKTIIFLQILIKILKIDATLNSFLAMQLFN